MEEVKVEKQKRGFMDWYFKSNLLLRILFGLILGAIVGLIVGPKIAVIKPFGDLLIRLLQMIVVPVGFFLPQTCIRVYKPGLPLKVWV